MSINFRQRTRKIRIFFVQTRNTLLFIILAIWHGTPFRLWPLARRLVEEDHLGEVRKVVWELKCEGLIYEDDEGRLWWKEDEGTE